jgi:hypothetical protein
VGAEQTLIKGWLWPARRGRWLARHFIPDAKDRPIFASSLAKGIEVLITWVPLDSGTLGFIKHLATLAAMRWSRAPVPRNQGRIVLYSTIIGSSLGADDWED